MMLALREALAAPYPELATLPIEALPDLGLAHQHLRLCGSGWLARIPKQSQMGLHAAEHLAYEAACFERAAASGHTPRLHGVLPPSAVLPRGALLVQEIIGRPVQLPQDLGALVQALAAIHSLPMPEARERAPLLDPFDPLAALLTEIEQQALHLDAALLAPQARMAIDAELLALRALCAKAARPSKQLISFDAHPGNFIVDAQGRAMLVDLEKARYGAAPLDLAHATLYTSTTWDMASHAELQPGEVVHAYEAWVEQMASGEMLRPWLVPLRRAMFLWSITWCAKWRALASQQQSHRGDGEDWSAELSDATLVAHVRERVNHYLSPAVVAKVCADNLALERELTL
jgi:Phosphotransferase enzyme family